MYLFNHMNQIKKYDVFDIFKDFCQIRLIFYKKRKEYLLNKLQNELLYIDAKIFPQVKQRIGIITLKFLFNNKNL